jgi:hypothetical protein
MPGDGDVCQYTLEVDGCDEDCCDEDGPAALLKLRESKSSDMVIA